MKRNYLLLTVSLAFVLASCSTADQKIPTIANDFCNCFGTLEKSMSTELKDIFVKAGDSEDPQAALTKSLMEMDPEKQASITEELQGLSSVQDPNSEVGKCMAELEKKYKNEKTRDKKKFGEKLLAELKGKSGCTLTYAIMKMGFQKEFD
jgi:hypothetical protein